MTRSEARAHVQQMLAAGMGRSAVFARLSGHGLKDSRLARLVAGQAHPQVLQAQRPRVKALVGVMLLLAVLTFAMGYLLADQTGPVRRWFVGGLLALVPLLFAWGFHQNRAGAYNAYIFLSVVQLPKQFEGFTETPIASSLAIAVSLALLGFVARLRYRLFPDLFLLSPAKVKGQYRFST
jgi:hypothetical protein